MHRKQSLCGFLRCESWTTNTFPLVARKRTRVDGIPFFSWQENPSVLAQAERRNLSIGAMKIDAMPAVEQIPDRPKAHEEET